MSQEDYVRAYKMGKKNYDTRMMLGQRATLEVLDEILPERHDYSEVSLGLVQIPVSQIVGTRTGGRSNSFAANFMPILKENTEFADKWSTLSTSHVKEGIHEPVKAYEYMNKFYVQEGNKRVSVMKYFGAVTIFGTVTRIIPRRTDEPENKLYYEFLDFYDCSKVNYVWFTKLGSFVKLQELVGKVPGEEWSREEQLDFSAIYGRFLAEYNAHGGAELSIPAGDAFLALIEMYGYREVEAHTTVQLKELIEAFWEEIVLLNEDESVDIQMNPVQAKKPLLSRILQPSISHLKIAFVYAKTPTSSAWTYSHELGRLHLEAAFSDEATTVCYENTTLENIDQVLKEAVSDGCGLIFTTTPSFAQASVKAAIANPKVGILNCSLNTSHRYIRTYYARMHEAKFLMGAIAGAMAEHGKLAYVADYPIYGSIANINAFALGAKITNPRAQVYLEWSSIKDQDLNENIRRLGVDCISGRDMVIPEECSRYFGIYQMDGEYTRNIAMPVLHWGRFYEQLIRKVMDGTWKYEVAPDNNKAINYWWGMSADVIDIICSKNLPIGTKRLVNLLKDTIRRGEFNPFSGILYSQKGIVQGDPERDLTPDEIVKMDWLAENVVGSIPQKKSLVPQAEPVVNQQGAIEWTGIG